ncbi:glycoside hydrolase [Streptomyces vinaceus]
MAKRPRLRALIAVGTLMAGILHLFSAQPAAAATWQGTVDWNDTRQTIDGFGGSTAFGMADNVMAYPTAKRNQILDALFSTTTGAGLTIIRNQIPVIQPVNGGAFTYTADNGQANFVDAARLRSPQIRLTATAWSPPGWMKSNGNENFGGTVLPAYWPAYATYLANYALRYQNRGTPLYAISPANEPDAATDYPSAQWSADDLRDFTKNSIAPAFSSAGVTAKYMIPENSYWDEDRALSSLADPAAAARVDIVAGHGYAQATDPQPFIASAAAGKPVWQTEMATLGAADDLTIADAMTEAGRIHGFMTGASASAFNHWWLATSKTNTREALVSLTTGFLGVKEYTIAKRLYAMAQWSRFVRPGWVRIGATAGDVPVSAFKDPATGKVAVVAFNQGTSSQTINLKLNGMSLSTMTPYRTSATENTAALAGTSTASGFLNYALPPSTITTFTGTAATTSPLAATVTEPQAWTGSSTTTTVKITNGGATANSGSVTMTAPTGVTPSPASFSFGPLAPGASVSVPVALTVDPTAPTGTPAVQAEAPSPAVPAPSSGATSFACTGPISPSPRIQGRKNHGCLTPAAHSSTVLSAAATPASATARARQPTRSACPPISAAARSTSTSATPSPWTHPQTAPPGRTDSCRHQR